MYNDDDGDEKRESEMIRRGGGVQLYSKMVMVMIQEKTGRKTRDVKTN